MSDAACVFTAQPFVMIMFNQTHFSGRERCRPLAAITRCLCVSFVFIRLMKFAMPPAGPDRNLQRYNIMEISFKHVAIMPRLKSYIFIHNKMLLTTMKIIPSWIAASRIEGNLERRGEFPSEMTLMYPPISENVRACLSRPLL